jgi:hypothetical protein
MLGSEDMEVPWPRSDRCADWLDKRNQTIRAPTTPDVRCALVSERPHPAGGQRHLGVGPGCREQSCDGSTLDELPILAVLRAQQRSFLHSGPPRHRDARPARAAIRFSLRATSKFSGLCFAGRPDRWGCLARAKSGFRAARCSARIDR